MKSFRAKSGPFQERPYYSDAEIENICSDELRAAALYPGSPSPVRIDRFIEKRFVTPTYDDLGEGILGLTVFGSGGVKEIIVSSTLEEDGSPASRRRIRTTLAHEGGHGLFHTHLFALAAPTKPLFGDFSNPAAPKVLCRDEAKVGTGYQGQWWEFQANKAIGALLMPKKLVEAALEGFHVATGSFGFTSLDTTRRDEAIRLLVDVFDVNPAVARIRLGQLFQVSEERQLTL